MLVIFFWFMVAGLTVSLGAALVLFALAGGAAAMAALWLCRQFTVWISNRCRPKN